MSGTVFTVRYPGDAEIKDAEAKLHTHIPPNLLPHVLLLDGIPKEHRESFLDAAWFLSKVSSNDSRGYFAVVAAWRSAGSDDSEGHFDGGLQQSTKSTPMAFRPQGSIPTPQDYSRESPRDASGIKTAPAQSYSGTPVTAHTPPGNFSPSTSLHPPLVNETNNVANQTADRQPFDRQNLPQLPLPPRNDWMTGQGSNAGAMGQAAQHDRTKPPAKLLICPTCGRCFSRPNLMESHAKKQCLNPQKCLSGRRSLPLPDGWDARQNKLPQRKLFASCLTARVFQTDKDLIIDARQHCRNSQGVPLSNQSARLKSLIAADRELRQAIETQCLTQLGNPEAWRLFTWDDEIAHRLATKAEFGQLKNRLPDIAVFLERHGLGFVDLDAYARKVIGKRSRLPTTSGAAPMQHDVAMGHHPEAETNATSQARSDGQAQQPITDQPVPILQPGFNDQQQSERNTAQSYISPGYGDLNGPTPQWLQDFQFMSGIENGLPFDQTGQAWQGGHEYGQLPRGADQKHQ